MNTRISAKFKTTLFECKESITNCLSSNSFQFIFLGEWPKSTVNLVECEQWDYHLS